MSDGRHGWQMWMVMYRVERGEKFIPWARFRPHVFDTRRAAREACVSLRETYGKGNVYVQKIGAIG